MIKVCTPFSYSFGNIGTVSNFWTPHYKILRVSFEVRLSGKTKSWGQVSRAQISPTQQDVICVDRDTDLEVRNVM